MRPVASNSFTSNFVPAGNFPAPGATDLAGAARAAEVARAAGASHWVAPVLAL